jgi:ABC-type transport system involved in cytochrome c biogenesis permease subunit
MMPILDDVMLRIHTVLIISSYAVITLGFAAANCYLFLAARRQRVLPAIVTIGVELLVIVGTAGYYAMIAPSLTASIGIGVASLAGVLVVLWGIRLLPKLTPPPLLSLAAASAAAPPPDHRGMQGGSIGSESNRPARATDRLDLFKEFDRSQCMLIYIATVALFVGIVLGAVWADYSWGRPWGWDPKEVFALNTWLIYAILIHARFVTKDRALWTAVLSIGAFAAMQFNWWVVNFYIVGLHSYA